MNSPTFNEFHTGNMDNGTPCRLEFSRCPLASEQIVRLTMRKPHSDDLLATWFEADWEAKFERQHLEAVGYTFVRMDTYGHSDSDIAPLSGALPTS